ncbi:hypothetical protein JG540_01965 [Actinomyces weissii]|uniref:Uncharacterized protein n=1 Tax=Actinomyces weissii TaxID=675090 RepID=A0A7T7MA09_9ACTO|nr:hypothetical protein [Actinomyces weissii]QQM67674.1 hypothetical protein JG540_01965 [Actinomyces weissii]
MCRPVTCKKCSKTTWAGCGQHVASVKAQVPPGQWCTCDRNAPKDGGATTSRGGFLSRLLGGR